MLATKEDYLILFENVHGVVARTFGPVRVQMTVITLL